MSIKNIKDKLKKNSKKDSSWIERAKYRKENKSWLDLSFSIAVKIISALKKNKVDNKLPSNQKELAEALGCSPQNVNKLLSGTENFKLETIIKIEKVLNIKLIEVPKFETTFEIEKKAYKLYDEPTKKIEIKITINYENLIGLYESKTDFSTQLIA